METKEKPVISEREQMMFDAENNFAKKIGFISCDCRQKLQSFCHWR